MAAAVLQGAWEWYKTQLAAKPMRTQIVTSGILWAAGDVMAQCVSLWSQQQKQQLRAPPTLIQHSAGKHQEVGSSHTEALSVDWKRVLTSSVFGAGFVAPVGHFWYEGLDNVVKRKLKLQSGSVRFISVKLFADTLILGPLHLLAFLTYMGVASGKTFEEVKGILKRDFIPAFVTEGAMWPLVQSFNFRFVPVQHQLLYVNAFCLFDSAFLSWFKHQEDTYWKRWLKSLLSPKLT